MMLSCDTVRADFPFLARMVNGAPIAYLDNAATTQKPRIVADAMPFFFAIGINLSRTLTAWTWPSPLPASTARTLPRSRSILSEALARQLFPNEDAVGKQIWMPGPGKDTPTIVGIVGDVKHQGLDQDVTPQVYVPYQQFALWSTAIVVRTTSGDVQFARLGRSVFHA